MPRRSISHTEEHKNIADVMYRVIAILETLEDNAIQKNTRELSQPTSTQTTFTLTQILTGLVALVSIVGAGFGTYNSLTSQIATQEVSNKMSIEQLKKDISISQETFKTIQNQINISKESSDAKIDKLSERIGELDNTINQIFNKMSTKN